MDNFKLYSPIILRYNRLMDAFTKSDDERDFYLNRLEGFIIYVDLDKDEQELSVLVKELKNDLYALMPKFTFFEIKKIMEGFVQEKVFDIDVKEKLLDIIGGREARENYVEFIYDNLTELEKWQLYYQEKCRIKIIEWLCSLGISFVFEEDLELNVSILEKVKNTIFNKKVSKEVSNARKLILSKAKTYYSKEALNPKPKRGRPPKQLSKIILEPQFTMDVYKTVSKSMRGFLYLVEITNSSDVTFSARFDNERDLLESLKGSTKIIVDEKLQDLSNKLQSLKNLSEKLKSSHIKESESKLTDKKDREFYIEDLDKTKVSLAAKEILPNQKKEIAPKKRFGIKKVAIIKGKKKKST